MSSCAGHWTIGGEGSALAGPARLLDLIYCAAGIHGLRTACCSTRHDFGQEESRGRGDESLAAFFTRTDAADVSMENRADPRPPGIGFRQVGPMTRAGLPAAAKGNEDSTRLPLAKGTALSRKAAASFRLEKAPAPGSQHKYAKTLRCGRQ